MSKVYILSQGEYSDYHVAAVFSTMEKAQEALPLFNANQNDIDEWTLDELPDHPPGLLPWIVHLDSDGNSSSSAYHEGPERTSIDDFGCDGILSGFFNKASPNCPAYWYFEVWARDEQHAVKIANEKRVQMIANGEWE